MTRTRLFHTVVIVGAGLLANCGKHTSPPAAGSSTKPADAAAPPADAAVDAPADAPVDAAPPIDAGTPAKPHPKKPIEIKKPPPNHVRIMIMRDDPPKAPKILEGM